MNDENYDVLNNLLDVLQERNYYQNYKWLLINNKIML
jgi:hypothetical protein